MPWWWAYTETLSPRPPRLHRISTKDGPDAIEMGCLRYPPIATQTADIAGGPFRADFVAKVENRTTLKISRKLIFRPLCRCVSFQRHCGGFQQEWGKHSFFNVCNALRKPTLRN